MCLCLSACGQPGVEIVKQGTVPENPSAPVGAAIMSYAGFRSVTWEQYVDARGVTMVLATGEYRPDLAAITDCPAKAGSRMTRASRVFLRMTFEVDLKAKTFAFTGAQYLVYSPKGYSMGYPGGLSAFEAILQGTSGLDCGVLYAPS
ncbi:MAG: hypothetical protein ACOZEN_12560 [Thermodesulfobacteriota bacterium]